MHQCPFKGCPTLIIRSDIDPEKFQDTLANVIIDIMLHEIGHSIDHIESNYNRYKSLRYLPFRLAVERYWEEGLSRTATQIVYPLERSFRHDHMPNYNPDSDSCYKEMAAELFVKFHSYKRGYGVDFADERLFHNYGDVWECYKRSICPEVGAFVEANCAQRIIQREGADSSNDGVGSYLSKAYGFVGRLWANRHPENDVGSNDDHGKTRIWMPEKPESQHGDTAIIIPPRI